MRYLFVLLVFLAGCGGAMWVKRGATPALFEADNSICEKRAIEAASQGSHREKDIFINCMLGRGWQYSR